jgi:hypothetical protein
MRLNMHVEKRALFTWIFNALLFARHSPQHEHEARNGHSLRLGNSDGNNAANARCASVARWRIRDKHLRDAITQQATMELLLLNSLKRKLRETLR